MKLLIDIGNTRIKYLLMQDNQLFDASEVKHLDYHLLSQALSSEEFSKVSVVIVASVQSHENVSVIESWALAGNIKFLQVHSQSKAYGVSSRYQQPEQLGVDRWLALIAARQLYPASNVLIIDAGTAITIDLLGKDGQHQGGWIMPGIQTMFDSLLNNTQKVIAEQDTVESLPFGDSTSQCVNYGIWAMAIGAINNAIEQANKTLTLDQILLTGGNSQQIARLMPNNYKLIPELLFHGLSCFRDS